MKNSNSKKNNNMKLVSVIVPVYNAEKYIKDCLVSLINQTYKNLEIICVDDGSTDHSLELLKLYAKKDNRIKIFTQENKGPAAARNLALDNAHGDYISFVDSDDTITYNAYEILVKNMSMDQNWDIVMFSGNVFGSRNEYLENLITLRFNEYTDIDNYRIIFQEKGAKPFLWLHFLKRELLEKPTKLRFDESMNLGEDQILQFCYVPRAKNVRVIEDKLYNYRVTENASLMQLYKNRRVKKTNVHFQIVEKIIKEWKKYGYYEVEKDELWTWIVSFVYWSIIDFPNEFRKYFAEKFFEIAEKNEVGEYLILKYEINHYKEMKQWLLDDRSTVESMKLLKEKTLKEKYEIKETLTSKAFKVGTILTNKSNRIKVKDEVLK